MDLPEKVRIFSGPQNRVNSVVILGKEGTVVVDTQVTLEDGQAVKRLAEESSTKPIVAVVITHEHFDHIAGNQHFACSIISTREARDEIEKSKDTVSQWIPGLKVTPPNIAFDSKCALHLGDLTLNMRAEGGHCRGECSIFISEMSTLITGDLVFNGRTPFIGSADIPQWIAALTGLYALDPELVIPGHGEPGGKEILLKQREWLERFMDGALSSKRKGLDASEACAQVLEAMGLPADRKQMVQAAVDKLYSR